MLGYSFQWIYKEDDSLEDKLYLGPIYTNLYHFVELVHEELLEHLVHEHLWNTLKLWKIAEKKGIHLKSSGKVYYYDSATESESEANIFENYQELYDYYKKQQKINRKLVDIPEPLTVTNGKISIDSKDLDVGTYHYYWDNEDERLGNYDASTYLTLCGHEIK